MRCERLTLSGDPGPLVEELRARVPTAESVRSAVAKIISRVRSGGDEAVRRYTREFDTHGREPETIRVEERTLAAAEEKLNAAVRRGLERAIGNIEAVAVARSRRDDATVDLGSHVIRARRAPVACAAVYVPGGRAPYPSTVLMGVVPARVAGVDDVSVCTPPQPDGSLNPVVAAACRLAGASSVYLMGGAQGVAALAYGTESVAPVDVIVGPGNLYVQEAKRQVFGQVGVDGFAGPSDLLAIVDAAAYAELAALDLLAQAEHGPGTLVLAASDSESALTAIAGRLADAPDTGAVAALIEVAEPSDALALAEAFAPEHLQLMGARAEALAPEVTRAGCVFVGALSGTAFGDYIAGSNHILPTAGAARYASAVSPAHFLRDLNEVRVNDASELAREAAPVARAEGFELHARSMEARIRENPAG
jgi:histidinol dehydrogenase